MGADNVYVLQLRICVAPFAMNVLVSGKQ